MSWANELVPPRASLRSLLAELTSAWRLYRQARVPLRERGAFLVLHALQLCAYRAGWNAGLRDLRDSEVGDR